MPSLANKFKDSVLREFVHVYSDFRNQKCTIGLFFAIFFVTLVLVGNVIWLISQNVWFYMLSKESLSENTLQLAILMVNMCFIEAAFILLAVFFVAAYGVKEIWHALVDKNRMRSPFYRVAILIASGVSNGTSSVLQVYAFTHTPMFLQSIILCTIPLSAQIWTVFFIAEERKRDYISFFFVTSLLLLVAGILLPSASAFKEDIGNSAKGVSLAWTFMYFLSCVIFGLWCVTQRLYLDALIEKESKPLDKLKNVDESTQPSDKVSTTSPNIATNEVLLAEKRAWGRQNVRENSGKLLLLVGSLLIEIIFLIILIPIDAIPWFGSSASASDAAKGFAESMKLIFKSWHNLRDGVLTSFGVLLSFVGCAYLNEESPTLASVVLQMAGPLNSLVIMIFPQWNVYEDKAEPGYKIGGVIFLFIAAFLYYMWDQISLQKLLKCASKPTRQPTEDNLIS